MIDIHSHVLSGLDDGAEDGDASLAMLQEAVAFGVSAIVATPHVRDDYPTSAASMLDRVAELQRAATAAGIGVEVLPGGELAVDRLRLLPPDEVRRFVLGGTSSALLIEISPVESPLDVLEEVRRLAQEGFRCVIAHPERNAWVQSTPRAVEALVHGGALVQITAGSLVGRFGKSAQRTAQVLLDASLVHVVATDTHGAGDRGACLPGAIRALRDPALAEWLTTAVPEAILADRALPSRPQVAARRRIPRLSSAWRSARHENL